MEDLKETIAAKEGLKLWFDRNLVKRKNWYDNCKAKIRALEKEIVADKKKLAKLTKAVVDAGDRRPSLPAAVGLPTGV